jgi:hypothetical protein
MPFKEAIEEAKKLIKHLVENPEELEKLSKGPIWERTSHKDDKAIDGHQKGVHRPATPSVTGEIFSAKKKGSGFSHAGLEQRKTDSFKNKSAIKDTHRQVLAEQRAMPKPNLPKAELDKSSDAVGKKISKLVHEGKPQKQAVATALNMEREHRLTPSGGYKHVKKSANELCKEDWQPKFHKPVDHSKGINKPAFHPKMLGVSQAHVATAGLSSASGKDVHRQVLAEQKAMPKPNLPKSEMAKGDVGVQGKHDVKGVHRDRLNQHIKGHSKSRLGILQDKANSDKPEHKQAWKEQHLKPEHEMVIAEQKAMKKPNLPKAEMAKGDYFRKKLPKIDEPAQEHAARKAGKEYSSHQSIKGVNIASTARPKGVSDVGAMVRNKNGQGNKAGIPKLSIQRTTAEQSKIKPKLPKSEMVKDELETGLDVIREKNDETAKKMREMLNDTAVQAGKIAEKFAESKGTLSEAIGTKNDLPEEKKEFTSEAMNKDEKAVAREEKKLKRLNDAAKKAGKETIESKTKNAKKAIGMKKGKK